MRGQGVENVLTLRGDPPRDQPTWRPAPGGFRLRQRARRVRARALRLLHRRRLLPETHPDAATPEEDLRNLKRKVDAGVDFLVTQLFFDGADYWRFVERARAAGIGVPIVPGVMPIVSAANLRRMASALAGLEASPPSSRTSSTRADGDDAALEVGVRWATRQCRELLERGAPGIHFYTLNRSPATRRVHEALFRR